MSVRKSTGLFSWNGEIHVDDSIEYEDGWLCFVAEIEEVDGKFGYYMRDDLGIFREDNEFRILADWPQFGDDNANEDIMILPCDHNKWYGIHAPLGKQSMLHVNLRKRG